MIMQQQDLNLFYLLAMFSIFHHWIGTGEGNPNTDLNYVQLAGTDKFADAFIGRFSVTTAQELQNALTQIHLYGKLYCNTCKEKYFYGFNR